MSANRGRSGQSVVEFALVLPLMLIMLLAIVVACTPSAPRNDIRQWTEDMMFRISPEPSPPRARERIRYKVVVLDRESRQPIETGEGRIFAMNADSAKTWDKWGYEHPLGPTRVRLPPAMRRSQSRSRLAPASSTGAWWTGCSRR